MNDKPIPDVSEIARPYWEAARREELAIQRCRACGAAIFYPRHWCPACFSLNLGWEKASGSGEVLSYSIIYQAPFESYAPDVPYVLAIIKLAEGPQMMTNIINCRPENIYVGMPVQVTFERRAGEFNVPQFQPRSGKPVS
ncbi:MAG: Zn-ribbon domain-containing OB-fold protein [Ktedonobacteraceae bacterium]|nr:Zn-ribbon domain-containing OB-fold protein [Ktedonobacteraceae bacterium]